MFNPFKSLGDLNEMRKQAAVIQEALEKQEFTVHDGNVRIVINGNQVVKIVEIDGVPNEPIRRSVNSAIKQAQQAAAMKLAEMSKNMEAAK
jgi:DNA-binding protein YbaB